MKAKTLNILSIICYGINILAGLGLIVGMAIMGFGSGKEGLEAAVAQIFAIIFIALGAIYVIVGIAPVSLKSVYLVKSIRKIVPICIAFDVIYTLCSAIMAIALVVSAEAIGAVGFFLLVAVSAVSLYINLYTLMITRDK